MLHHETRFFNWRTQFIFLLIFMMCLPAYFWQTHRYIYHDVAIILHTAIHMYGGESYATGLLEPNPPLIFYIHFIPIFISRVFGLNVLKSFFIFVLSLIGISLMVSYWLLNQIAPQKRFRNQIFLVIIALAFIFFHNNSFGQREHLFIILTFPYLLLLALRIEHPNAPPIPSCYPFIIGLVAGIGFSIKPHFYFSFLAIELFWKYKKAPQSPYFTPERLGAIFFIVFYWLWVVVYFKAYYLEVLPLWQLYYSARVESLTSFSALYFTILPFVCLLLMFYSQRENKHDALLGVFGFYCLGAVIAFLIPRVFWYYHFYPIVAISIIFGGYRLLLRLEKKQFNLINIQLICFYLAATGGLFLQDCFESEKMQIKTFFSTTPRSELINFFEKQRGIPTYQYISLSHHLNVIEFYSKAQCLSHYPVFWEFVPKKTNHPHSQSVILHKKMIRQLAQTLKKNKPDYIIVDEEAASILLKKPIHYLKIYAEDPTFKEVLNHYRFLKKIPPYAVYERWEEKRKV